MTTGALKRCERRCIGCDVHVDFCRFMDLGSCNHPGAGFICVPIMQVLVSQMFC